MKEKYMKYFCVVILCIGFSMCSAMSIEKLIKDYRVLFDDKLTTLYKERHALNNSVGCCYHQENIDNKIHVIHVSYNVLCKQLCAIKKQLFQLEDSCMFLKNNERKYSKEEFHTQCSVLLKEYQEIIENINNKTMNFSKLLK